MDGAVIALSICVMLALLVIDRLTR